MLYVHHGPVKPLCMLENAREIQRGHYLANSSFCQVLMAILVVFQNGRYRKYKEFITLLVLDLYKQTWRQNIHFEGPEIQWRCCQVDRIFTFASSKLFDYLLKIATNENA